MEIQQVDLKRQYASIQPEMDEAIHGVLQRTDFIMGKPVEEFEKAYAAFSGAKHCIGLASGTAAIHLALAALNIGPGDEVITVSHTFIASAEPVVYLGAKPVFVEVEPDYFTLDPAKLEAAITPKTKAILPVHIYGQCADMAPILEIAARHNIPVIEDAAQAQGSKYHGNTAGTLGLAACFSFYPGKNLGAYGDAGALTTNDDALAERVRRIRNHGRQPKLKYEHFEVGYGERLDTLQAAVLKVKLSYLADWNEKRRWVAARYNSELEGIPGLKLPPLRPGCEHIYHQYVLRTEQRDALGSYLQGKGIHTGVHYPMPLHLQPAFKYLGYKAGDFPVTEKLASTVLSLPMFAELTEDEMGYIIQNVRDFFKA